MKWNWFFAVAAASLAGVVGYNFWAYCCGRCSIEDFLSLGPFGTILMGGVFLMTGILLVLKIRGRRSDSRCRCGCIQDQEWLFCPACGTERR